jgi:hypothetical protein
MTMAKNRRNTARADPIFAALENHKKLDRAWLDMEHAREARPLTVKRREVDRASDAADKAAWRMARTRPTTVAGASAMLTYIATEPVTGFFELGEASWHETAFRTVTAALAKIARSR